MKFNLVKRVLLCGVLMFASNIHADSPALQKAIDAYSANQLDSAYALFVDLSKQKNAEAYYYLGLIYNDTRFKDYNPNKAVSYLLSAVDLGHSQAMFTMGLMYDNGNGVKQDALKALDWYRKAKLSERDYVKQLTFFRETDNGLKELNYPEIFTKLLHKAENGNVEAQYQVAENFDTGALIPRDLTKALFWYRKAADNKDRDAQYILGYFYCRGIAVTKDIQIANQWLAKSGRQARCSAQ